MSGRSDQTRQLFGVGVFILLSVTLSPGESKIVRRWYHSPSYEYKSQQGQPKFTGIKFPNYEWEKDILPHVYTSRDTRRPAYGSNSFLRVKPAPAPMAEQQSSAIDRDEEELLAGIREFEESISTTTPSPSSSPTPKRKKPPKKQDPSIRFNDRKMEWRPVPPELEIADLCLTCGGYGCPSGTIRSPNGRCVPRVRAVTED